MGDNRVQNPGAMERLVAQATATPEGRAAFEAEQARLANDPDARYRAAGMVPPAYPGALPTRADGDGETLVRTLVQDTVTEYIHLVSAEPEHALHVRLASPSDADREAMALLVYNLALLAGVYTKAATIDVDSLHREVKREVRGRPWLRSMAYDYIAQTVEDPAVALSLKALVG